MLPNRETWTDWLGNGRSEDVRCYRPRTAEEVADIVRAEPKLKVIGAGHADNRVARPNPATAMIDPTEMSDIALEPRTAGSGLVRAEAGARIRDVNRRLGMLGRALENMGSFDEQTISGALATGTHGSGLDLGPLCDQVRAFELVDGRGRRWRVDDPKRPIDYVGGEPLRAAGVEWVKDDDDLFRSLGVNVGAFGMVTALVIDTLPAYRLWERRVPGRFEDLDVAQIVARAEKFRHYEMLINPNADNLGKHAIVETYRDRVNRKNGKDVFVNRPNGWPKPSPMIEREAVLLSARAGAEFTSFLTWRREPDEVGPRLTKSMSFLAADKKVFVADSTEILILRLGARAHGFELFVPLKDGGDTLERVLAAVFERAADWNRAGERPEQRCVATSPMGLRFVKGSPQLLAPASRDTVAGACDRWATLEIPRLAFPEDEDSASFPHYPDAMVHDVWHDASALGCRAHWGQANFLAPGDVAAAYPGLATWQGVADRMDPDRRFVNLWGTRIGLR